MMKFEIYSGLKNEFGGANFLGTFSFETEEDAKHYAYCEARDLYEVYNGLQGINTVNQILNTLKVNKETAESLWLTQRNDYLDYFVKEVSN